MLILFAIFKVKEISTSPGWPQNRKIVVMQLNVKGKKLLMKKKLISYQI